MYGFRQIEDRKRRYVAACHATGEELENIIAGTLDEESKFFELTSALAMAGSIERLREVTRALARLPEPTESLSSERLYYESRDIFAAYLASGDEFIDPCELVKRHDERTDMALSLAYILRRSGREQEATKLEDQNLDEESIRLSRRPDLEAPRPFRYGYLCNAPSGSRQVFAVRSDDCDDATVVWQLIVASSSADARALALTNAVGAKSVKLKAIDREPPSRAATAINEPTYINSREP